MIFPPLLSCISVIVSAWMPPPAAEPWYHSSVGYQIFVASFADSNGDGWGDLQGIIDHLDYLNDGDDSGGDDLGITLLWLTPTFPSPSYHGYDVTDYRAVHPRLGTAEQMKTLIREARRRNIRVLLDLVMNHTSREHPWFVASRDSSSPYRDWYLWKDQPVPQGQPWNPSQTTWHRDGEGQYYYGLFSPHMPDLNYRNPAVLDEMKKIALFWLKEFDVAGFRLDAVRYLVETHERSGQQDTRETLDQWRDFGTFVRKEHPDALLLGEAWVSNLIASRYHVDGKGMILTFDFDFMGSVVNGILAEDASDIQGVYERFSEQFPPGAGQATFVSNHDVPRLATRLNGDPQALRLAAMLLMTLPGTPFVYYGQELGLPNGPGPQDEQKRLPMPWKDLPGVGFSAGTPWIAPQAGAAALSVLTQQRNPESLLNLYRRMIRLRKSHPALLRGGMSSATIQSSSSGDTWAFFRTLPDSRVLVVVNMGTEPAENVSIEYPVPEKALQVKPAAILVNPQVVSHARGSEATETVLFPSATTLSRSRHSLMIANIAPRSLVVIDLREEAR